MAKNDQKKFWPKNFVFFYRDLALAVSVVLPPWDPFFDFSFPSYGRFREGNPSFCHFAAPEGSPHENGRNSETKSRKMDLKVPNRPLREGYKRAFDEILPKKMSHFLILTMFRPRPGNVVQRKKYRFTK